MAIAHIPYQYSYPCLHYEQAFASYLAYKRENNELLLFLLRQLASDQLTYNRNRYGGEVELIEIPEDEFVDKVGVAVVVLFSFVVLVCMSRSKLSLVL